MRGPAAEPRTCPRTCLWPWVAIDPPTYNPPHPPPGARLQPTVTSAADESDLAKEIAEAEEAAEEVSGDDDSDEDSSDDDDDENEDGGKKSGKKGDKNESKKADD